MKVKFFADDHNARFTWSWVNGEHITDDAAETEHLKGLGLRFEEAEGKKVAEKKSKKDQKKASGKGW